MERQTSGRIWTQLPSTITVVVARKSLNLYFGATNIIILLKYWGHWGGLCVILWVCCKIYSSDKYLRWLELKDKPWINSHETYGQIWGMDKSDSIYMRMHGFQVLGSQNIKAKFSLHHTADSFSLMKITLPHLLWNSYCNFILVLPETFHWPLQKNHVL